MAKRKLRGKGIPKEILSYYLKSDEASRLLKGYGRLEFTRTMDILDRYLPPPPATILDVGGGSGVYAFPLTGRGYEVHLVDAVPLHIEQANQRGQEQPDGAPASAKAGDARSLEQENDSQDAVLLLGPLYHLTEKSDRALALTEAYRVLRPGGMVFAAAISRFASSLAGFTRAFLEDPEFERIAEQDLIDGQHRNVSEKVGYFTTAYFHLPEELKEEVDEAGFTLEKMLAVEGPMWMLQDIDQQWEDSAGRERILRFSRRIEDEPSMLGVSAHIMAIARKGRPNAR